MKKTLLFFSALLCVSAVNSQTDASVMLQCSTAYTVSSSSTDNSYIATLPGGENIMATNVSDGTNRYINIKKIHLDGSVSTIKNIVFTGVEDNSLKGLSCSSTGNISCFFGSGTTFYLMKLNSTGSVLWQKQLYFLDGMSNYYSHSMNETPAGEYYITLSEYGFMGLTKIDANGDLLWSKKVTGPRDTGKCPAFCTEVTLSGGCISTLKDDSYETIVNFAPDGSLNWSRSFGDMQYRWTRSIKKDNLGNFYIVGTYGSTGSSFVQKMDANGNIIYAKNVPGTVMNMSGTPRYADAFVSASNELYLISEYPEVELAKVGPTGNILWSKGIGAMVGNISSQYSTYFSKNSVSGISFHCWMNDTTTAVFKFSGDPSELCNSYNNVLPNTADDAQIFDATIDSTANINPLTVTITNSGFGTSATEYYTSRDFCSYIASVTEATANMDLNVYPNPASSFINIDLGTMKNIQDAAIVMYDMTGRKVLEKQISSTTTESISTSEYAPGLYTIIIRDSKAILGKQRVVIQK